MKKILSSQRGVTLIEVLATLVIMAIVSGVIYSTFTTGLKLYQKIGIEGQLRDDADYVATLILNEIYDKPPHYVKNYSKSGAEGIYMVRFTPKNVDKNIKYKITDSTDIEQELWIYFEENKLYLKRNDSHPIEISSDSSEFLTKSDGKIEESTIEVSSCSQWETGGTWDSSKDCQHGIISLDIVIGDSNDGRSNLLKTDPLELQSTFGF